MADKQADQIGLEILIEAPHKEVWRAWTDPDLILLWIGSEPDSKGLDAKLNVYPGGEFEIHFLSSDHTEHVCYGIYRDVVEFSRLCFTWQWRSEPGVESFVSIFLSALGEQTLMRFEHEGFGYQSAHNYAEGWKGTFLKLNKLLSKA